MSSRCSAGTGEPAGRRIDRNHLVPEAAQRRNHLRGARDRDVPLLARAAKENRDLHPGFCLSVFRPNAATIFTRPRASGLLPRDTPRSSGYDYRTGSCMSYVQVVLHPKAPPGARVR